MLSMVPPFFHFFFFFFFFFKFHPQSFYSYKSGPIKCCFLQDLLKIIRVRSIILVRLLFCDLAIIARIILGQSNFSRFIQKLLELTLFTLPLFGSKFIRLIDLILVWLFGYLGLTRAKRWLVLVSGLHPSHRKTLTSICFDGLLWLKFNTREQKRNKTRMVE